MLIAGLLIALIVSAVLHKNDQKLSLSTKSQHASSQSKQPKPTTSISHKVGDTQQIGSLSFKLDRAVTQPASDNPAGGITNPSDIIFAVELTVTNNGSNSLPNTQADGPPSQSMVYTSDGKYIEPYLGSLSVPGCAYIFGDNGPQYINPGESATGCIAFEVPNSVLVDTYFYGQSKWYF